MFSSSFSNVNWTPVHGRTLSQVCLARIKKDMVSLQKEQFPGIFAVHDENDISLIHALIIGPKDTPYEGGLFYFIMRCPDNYPISPPHVKLMTTGAGTVNFNPHLYANGYVCLSILGTIGGPPWSPAQTLATVLVSIQSMMNENPYEEQFFLAHGVNYNDTVRHETIRVAVCGMLDNETRLTIPESLQISMKKAFLENFDYYENTARRNMGLSGQVMARFVCIDHNQRFQYDVLFKKLQELKEKCKFEVTEEEKKKRTTEVEENPSDAKRTKLETPSDRNTLSDTESDDDSDWDL